MKKIFLTFAVFCFVTSLSLAQTSVVFHVKKHDGQLMTKDANSYSVTFEIEGLLTDEEADNFTTAMLSKDGVISFQIYEGVTVEGKRKATLVVIKNDLDFMQGLFSSMSVRGVNLEGKEYSVQNLDELKDALQKSKSVNRESKSAK